MTPPEEELDKILKREQEYVQQCTLANIDAARRTGQWIIHDLNRKATVGEISKLIQDHTNTVLKSLVEELINKADEFRWDFEGENVKTVQIIKAVTIEDLKQLIESRIKEQL